MKKTTWKWQEDMQIIKGFRLMDDDFMTICLNENQDCMNLILHILLETEIHIDSVQTQRFLQNLHERSIQMDVFASDTRKRIYNLEIQRSDKGAGKHRARYHASMIDVNVSAKGSTFDELTESYVIFINFLGCGNPLPLGGG